MAVQIPDDLYRDLVAYHLRDNADPETAGRIRAGLRAKEDAQKRRRLYSMSVDEALPAEDRAIARRASQDLFRHHKDTAP